jgi:hypothetical protein
MEVLRDTRWVLGEAMAPPHGWECSGPVWSTECVNSELFENKGASPYGAVSAAFPRPRKLLHGGSRKEGIGGHF